MTASSANSNLPSERSYRRILAGLCALSFGLPLTLGLADSKGNPGVYTLILAPHVVTMIFCLLAGGGSTFGLAKGVSFIAALMLGVAVPVLSLLESAP